MANLFSSLDQVLEGNTVNASVTLEAEHLADIVTVVARLISNPPDDFQGFVQQLAEMPLPDLDVSADLGADFGALQDLLPDDLGNITSGLDTALMQIEAALHNELGGPLADALQTIGAVYTLLTRDMTCGIAAEAQGQTAQANNGNGSNNGGDTGNEAQQNPGSIAGTPGPSGEDIDSANALLDLLPDPLNVESFLHWLHNVIGDTHIDGLLLRAIPVFDDIRDPLATLLAWKEMNEAELTSHIQSSLEMVESSIRQSVADLIPQLLGELDTLSPQFQQAALIQIGDGTTAGLTTIASAVESGDLSGIENIVTDINNLLDQNDAISISFEADVQPVLEPLTNQLLTLHHQLEDSMEYLVSLLQPSGQMGKLTQFGDWSDTTASFSLSAFSELQDTLNDYSEFFSQILDKIDFTALQEPLTTAAQTLRDSVDSIDQAMVMTTLQVQSQLSGVEEVLDGMDTSMLTNQAQTAIDEFSNGVITELSDAFEPARTALEQAVATISQTTDQFDPAAIISDLEMILGNLTAVFDDPAIQGALNEIRSTLDSVSSNLESLSFSAVTDEVIATIGEVAQALSSIDTSDLSDALKFALAAALKVLPKDIRPVTDSLIDEFGALMEAGPLSLIDTIKDQPARLFDKVREFEPGRLLGDALSHPYNELLGEMDEFRPSVLLDPVDEQFEIFRQRLNDNVNPAQAVAPLVSLHQQLVDGFDTLRPSDLVSPLNERLNTLINSGLDASPLDEGLDSLNTVIEFLQKILGVANRLVQLVERVRDLFAGFSNAENQLDTFVTDILSKVDSIADTSALSTTLANLSGAIDATHSGAITVSLTTDSAAIQTLLDTFNPEAQLTTLVQAYHGVSRTALDALPDSPQKSAIIGLLDRFDPSSPVFNSAFQALANLKAALNNANLNVATLMIDWDVRFHAEGGTLDGFREADASAAQLRQWVEEVLESQFLKPLRGIFYAIEQTQGMLSEIITPFSTFLTELEDKFDSLVTGPDSLSGIRDAITELEQHLRDVDLGFFADSLDDLFDTVKGKLEAAGPAVLGEALDDAFQQMLEQLNLNLVIPEASLSQLDQDYEDVIGKLRDLDPALLVLAIVQPKYDETLEPILESFDVTPLLSSVVEVLTTLEDELRSEMDQVNKAYEELLRSVPDVDGSLSITVGF